MSLPSSDDASAGFYRKPGPDLYTVLLLVAFLALAIGTVFLYLEGAEYGPTPAGEPNVQTGMALPRSSDLLVGGRTCLDPARSSPA
jgi:hypothetical protein